MNKKIAVWPGKFGLANSSDSYTVRVLVFLLAMVALWTVLCGISHRAPDLDGMEELVWASSFELGYYKHPPLPSWFMYALTGVFGKPVWLAFFAAQLFSALGLWFVWRLGCEFTTPRKAAIATLMVSTTIYFSVRGTIYNHNTVQLWSIAASTWLFYRALRYQKVGSWVGLGVVSALAMYTKYSALVQFAAFFCFLIWQGYFRQSQTLKGCLYALLSFAVVFSPHIYWLATHAFEPLYYADKSIDTPIGYTQALLSIIYFLLDQLARLSPMLVAWAALFYWNRRSPPGVAHALATQPDIEAAAECDPEAAQPYVGRLSAWDRSFLLWMGLAPVGLTVLVSAALGTWLEASWGTTFFILYGFFVFWWLAGAAAVNLRRTVILVIAIHVLMAVGYALARGPVAYELGRSTRSTFPGVIISTKLDRLWHEHVPAIASRLVASDTWLGGNIAIHGNPDTVVFIDASYEESPWLDRRSALDCGVLIAYSKTLTEPALALKRLYQRAQWQGVLTVPWTHADSQPIIVHWGIIPPLASCAAGR